MADRDVKSRQTSPLRQLDELVEGVERLDELLQEAPRVDIELLGADLSFQHCLQEQSELLRRAIDDRVRAQETLQRRENELLQLLQEIREVFWICNHDGSQVHYISPACERIWGVPAGTFYQHPELWMETILLHDRRRVIRNFLRFEGASGSDIEFRIRHVDGTERWLRGHGFFLPTAEESEPAMAGVVEDITELKADEEQIQQSLAQLRATLESTRDAILVLDNDGMISTFNSRFGEVWGFDPDSLREWEDSKLFFSMREQLEDLDTFDDWMRSVQQTPEAVSEGVLELLDGRILEASSLPQRLAGRILGRVWNFRDVTERQQAQALISYQASYDVLTDLPNRRMVMDQLQQTLARCRRNGMLSALLFLDLDGFKTINDTLGHAVGDALLKQVAGRLVSSLRKDDTAARLGGDEFLLLLSEFEGDRETVQRQVSKVVEKLREGLAHPYQVEGHNLYATPSIGVVLFPLDNETADDVLLRADSAMYRSKDAGRNTISFYLPGGDGERESLLRIQTDLHKAMELRQLQLHWQPQLDKEGVVCGAEALLRWNHPEMGLLAPEKFIRIAEENGLIRELGDWVLLEACQMINRLKQELPDCQLPNIAINVSPQQFRQADFAERIRRVLEQQGVEPWRITLELTENMLARGLDEITRKMGDLKRIGVRFSIDDFGTGYSSMAYLRRLPLDEIKIDKSFVADLASDQDTVSIIEAIITMASKLGLHVVAEGVESHKDGEFLRKRGCNSFQGFHYSRPMGEAEFFDYLQNRPHPDEVGSEKQQSLFQDL